MTEQAKDRKAFLSRWSERKLAARSEEAAPDAGSSAGEPSADDPAPDAAIEDAATEDAAALEANRSAAEAIDLEALTDKSDYAPFFRPGVPAALRSAALRRLWRSNPVFAVLDGLNDHDLDYRWPAPGSEVVRTGWKVGRGFVEDVARAGQKIAEVAAEAEPDAAPPREAPPREEVAALPAAEPVVAAEGGDEEAAPERAERPKVGLAQRLDLAAFREKDGR